ncbi:uncharacterized protein LOC110974180 isoform X3 [Acanthaster planci]|nr:uncharacterized protein LOC110974180 isoform X3 [Acanthaster planci]
MASNTSRKTEFDSLRKALFHSPTALEGNQQDEPDWPLLTRLQVEHDTEVCMKNVQKGNTRPKTKRTLEDRFQQKVYQRGQKGIDSIHK